VSRLTRSRPLRPAWLYPVGTTLRLRDGRGFRVATRRVLAWVDPSMGCGDGNWRWVTSGRFWVEVV